MQQGVTQIGQIWFWVFAASVLFYAFWQQAAATKEFQIKHYHIYTTLNISQTSYGLWWDTEENITLFSLHKQTWDCPCPLWN